MLSAANPGRSSRVASRWGLGGRLVQGAAALMLSTGGSALLGVVFWGVAAHLASPTIVGRTSAELAAMVLLANLAQLSFGTIFERFLPVAGSRTRGFIGRAYVMCVSTAIVITTVYVSAGWAHGFLPNRWWTGILFVVVVVTWTIFILQDSALIGLRASKWVPVENILYGAAKLALLPFIVMLSASQGIFIAWTAPVAGAIAGVSWFLFRRRIPQLRNAPGPSEKLPDTPELFRLALAQYSTILFGTFSPAIVNLIVLERLGAPAAAHYYLPTLFTSGIWLLVYSVVRSFMVEAASERSHLRQHALVATRAIVAVTVPCIVVGEAAAPFILGLFGDGYASAGTTLFRLLLLSIPLTTVSIFYSTFAWLDKRVWWMSIREILSAAIFFAVLLALIGHLGIVAIGWASIVSSGLQGLFFLPITIRRIRSLPVSA